MEFVQPIRNTEDIEKIKQLLLKSSYRDYVLFITGLNTGLRISDILKLKVKDVKDRTHIVIKEEKTGKSKRFLINNTLKDLFDKFIINMNNEDYLFQSRNGNNQSLSRSQAYRIINIAARKARIKDKIGTHTLRKTFGYHHYQLYKDIAVLQTIFNHSAPSVTLRYIGINDDVVDKSLKDFSL